MKWGELVVLAISSALLILGFALDKRDARNEWEDEI